MVRALVVIPARGGSKGLPRKNVMPIAGMPLVARAILAARNARLVHRVVVSTDDAEIAAVAQAYGAAVVRRPADISGDTASSESALIHALDYLLKHEGYEPQIVALLQCTSPFVIGEDIDGTLGQIVEGGADSAFAAVPYHHFLWRRDSVGKLFGVNHSGGPRQRRQDRDPEYLEAGSVYAMKVDVFRREGHRFCGRQALHVSEPSRCLEIDDQADLDKARSLWPVLRARHDLAALPRRLSAIVFDFDGVFTDNGVTIGQEGCEAVRCDRGDGLGIEQLRKRSVPMLVLSKERNPVVAARCAKLGLPCIQGEDEKLPALRRWLSDNAVDSDGLIYVGNDVNDSECLRFSAYAVGPCDAHPDVTALLHLTLSASGGRGAVRELADLVCKALDSGQVELALAGSEAKLPKM